MGIFGTTDITQIGTNNQTNPGLVASGLNMDDLALRVIAYDAAGNFKIQQHFRNPEQGDDLEIDETNPTTYFTIIEHASSGLNGDESQISGVEVNIQQLTEDIGLGAGDYTLVINLVTTPIRVSITEISDDRLQVSFDQFSDRDSLVYIGNNLPPEYIGPYRFDFGEGRNAGLLNWTPNIFQPNPQSTNVITSLTEPAPEDIQAGLTYFYMDITQPSAYSIHIVDEPWSPTYIQMHPNFDIRVTDGAPVNTNFKTFDQITSTVSNTKHDILNKYLSSSFSGMDINIDYQNPENFINFSSYEERLLNFKYKLQLIEQYDTELATIDGITGAVATSVGVTGDRSTIDTKRRDVIGNFDGFEKYMYTVSSSGTSGSYGEFWSNAWPKNTTVAPHRIFATTSSEAQAWVTDAIESASFYDRNNPNMLSKALPEYILNNQNNQTIFTVIDMIAQHYDVIWTYIKSLTDKNIRDEDLNIGIPKDLLWHVGTSLGINMPNGNNAADLWKWALGTDESGSIASSGTGLESGSLPQLSAEDVTKATWSRLINNIPYFIRTRGTTRGVKAVLACYGVPSTILDVKEYGGPKGVSDSQRQVIQEDRFTYQPIGKGTGGNPEPTLDGGNIPQMISPNFHLKSGVHDTTQAPPQGFEFRFKTTHKSNMILFGRQYDTSGSGFHVSMFNSSSMNARFGSAEPSAFGCLTLFMSASAVADRDVSGSGVISASTQYMPIYDGDWWNVALQAVKTPSTTAAEDITVDNQTFRLDVKRASDHGNGTITNSGSTEITADGSTMTSAVTASYNNAWRFTNHKHVPGGAPPSPAASGIFNFYEGHYWLYSTAAPLYLQHNGRNPSQFKLLTTTHPRENTSTATGAQLEAFSGSLQEFRVWGEYLDDDKLEQHTLSPLSYVGKNYSSSFDNLWARFPLGSDSNKYNLSGSNPFNFNNLNSNAITALSSSHPNQSLLWCSASVGQPMLTASFWSGSDTGSGNSHFVENVETHYLTTPSTPSNTLSSNKIRLEDSMLTHQLNAFTRAEVSEYDRHPIDTHTIGIHLSLQHSINRDISQQLGALRVDNFIGDPSHLYEPNYPDLEKLNRYYFKKLDNKPDVGDFTRIVELYDSSLFQVIKSMVPARVNPYVGLLIEPTILERSKVQKLPPVSKSFDYYESNRLELKDMSIPSMSANTGVTCDVGSYQEEVYHLTSSLNADGLQFFQITGSTPHDNPSQTGEESFGLRDTIGLTDSASYNGARYIWTNTYRNKNADGTFTVGTELYTSDPLNTVVTASRASTYKQVRVFNYSSSFSASWDTNRGHMAGGVGYGLSDAKAALYNGRGRITATNGSTVGQRGKAHIYTGSYHVPRIAAESGDTEFAGFTDARYKGCKLIGEDYNADSGMTFDGSPVIELYQSNPNQLIVKPQSVFGGTLQVPGITIYPNKFDAVNQWGQPVSPIGSGPSDGRPGTSPSGRPPTSPAGSWNGPSTNPRPTAGTDTFGSPVSYNLNR